MIFKKLTLAVILLSLSISSCNNSDNVVEYKKTTLVMGTTADYPPFEFIKEKKIRGFDIDLANIIAKKLGYSVYIRDMNFDSLIPALQTNRIDFAMSGFSSTPERNKNISLSIPYYVPTYAMMYSIDKPLINKENLVNKTIGVQLGTTMETYLKTLSNDMPGIKIISLTRIPSMIQELKVQRLDGVLIEIAQAKIFANKNPNLRYSLFPSEKNEGYVVAFPKQSNLKEQFDDVIIKLRDSGELDELKKKWLF